MTAFSGWTWSSASWMISSTQISHHCTDLHRDQTATTDTASDSNCENWKWYIDPLFIGTITVLPKQHNDNSRKHIILRNCYDSITSVRVIMTVAKHSVNIVEVDRENWVYHKLYLSVEHSRLHDEVVITTEFLRPTSPSHSHIDHCFWIMNWSFCITTQ